MGDEHSRNRRELYRMRMPRGKELFAVLNEIEYQVVEISERGLRIIASEDPTRHGVCKGYIIWSSGIRSEIQGEFGRFDNGEHIIIDVAGIKMNHVVDEQRRVIRTNGLQVRGHECP